MKKINISNLDNDLFKIESFVESICEEYRLEQNFHGNVLIALTEIIEYFEKHNLFGELSFEKSDTEISFKFEIKKNSVAIDAILNVDSNNLDLFSEGRTGIFIFMSLCDDFIIDSKNSIVRIVFKFESVSQNITTHRKKYLKNYLAKAVEEANR